MSPDAEALALVQQEVDANVRLIADLLHELTLAADTFRDFSNVLRAIGHDTMSAAAGIAERSIRERLAAIARAEAGQC